jgi:hypothetical protein
VDGLGATQRGHDHDTADYEIYIWEVGTAPESAARLTFHSSNDRWPDIFIPGTVAAAPAPADKAPPPAPAKTTASSKSKRR